MNNSIQLTRPVPGVTGLVLAGGLGRRMSRDGRGTNKALTPLNDRPMIAHVIDRLAPQVEQIMLNVNNDCEAFSGYHLPLVRDVVSGFQGPLAGLHAGMNRCTTPWILTVPCDSPFLPQDLATRLMQGALDKQADIAVVRTGDRLQPVFTLARCRLLDNLAGFLSGGGRKIDAWYAALSVAEVTFEDSSAFRNINTPEDLAAYSGKPAAPNSPGRA